MTDARDHDIVVHGASGFVGRLTASHLAEHAPDGVRIALSGRSEDKLAAVRSELPPRAADWPLIVADAADDDALGRLAASTRVVATTVGPYRRYGLPLVAACARSGTHYADLTGEVLFMRETIDRHHAEAEAAGARIVHCCGFDSIPSDLGTYLLAERVAADGAGELADTQLVVVAMKGGVSGGTLASMTGQLEEVRSDPEHKRVVEDPYSLSPDRDAEPDVGKLPDIVGPTHDDDLGLWLGPFAMASINTRVVRRSNALRGWSYGRRFRYREAMSFGSGRAGQLKAVGTAAGLGAFVAGLGFGPTRALLDRVLPSPGEGPSEKTRQSGFFTIEVHTTTTTGARYVAKVAAKGDPGYAATAVMLGESALTLALDGDRLPDRAGVLTPSTAMGDALVDRLRGAGQTLNVRAR